MTPGDRARVALGIGAMAVGLAVAVITIVEAIT
jgi:hypothetical protein